MARSQVEKELEAWATVANSRDQVVRDAYLRGLSTVRIHQITGLARSTITRILDGEPMANRLTIDDFLKAGGIATTVELLESQGEPKLAALFRATYAYLCATDDMLDVFPDKSDEQRLLATMALESTNALMSIVMATARIRGKIPPVT